MKKVLKKFGVSLLAVVGSLVVVEIVLALSGQISLRWAPLYAGDREVVSNDQVHELVGWKMPPSARSHDQCADYDVSYGSNASGFRDGGPADPSRRRIAFLGDSMTFGIGVEDDQTFCEAIEPRLAVDSSNFGMSGFGIDQMWMTLRHYALAEDPDLVVVSFILDDMQRSLTAYRERGGWLSKPTFLLEDGGLVEGSVQNRPNLLARFINQKSRLRELTRRLESRLLCEQLWGERWLLNQALFASMAEDCRNAGIPMMVVFLIPRGSTQPCLALARGFEELDLPFLDLQQALADPSLFFEHDRHLNPDGHEFVADRLAEFIEEHELLPE